MKVKLQDTFVQKLNRKIAFIARDKPIAARRFKKDPLTKIKQLVDKPFKNKRSIYFNDETIWEMTFKGYTIIYKIYPENDQILVFCFNKWEENAF